MADIIEMCQPLAKKGSRGFYEFVECIKSGNVEDVRRSFKMEFLEMEDKNGCHAIHVACAGRSIGIVQFLLEKNREVGMHSDHRGKLPIHYGVIYDAAVIKLLMEWNFDIETGDLVEGKTAFHYACENGNIEVIRLLIQNNFDIECRDRIYLKRGIHYASENGRTAIVKLLIDHKCNSNAPDGIGIQPIHFACQNGNIEVIRLLIENGCDLEAMDQSKHKPIYYAFEKRNIEAIKFLIENDCDITDCYQDLVKISRKKRCQELITLLRAVRMNQPMSKIAFNMGLGCENRCNHKTCFISALNDMKSLECIGCGGYGKIYKWSGLGREVAIKMVDMNMDADNKKESKYIEDNINKYRRLLNHDRILKHFGSVIQSQCFYVFMEFAAGGSLKNKISRSGPLTHQEIVIFSKEILEGVKFLHNLKITHRDIKPQNILLSSLGKVKLADFGVSRLLKTISTKYSFVGTPNYMAPEVINNEPYSYPADIWSVGATVIEMLTGKAPYDGLMHFQVIYKIGTLRTIEYDHPVPKAAELESFIDDMINSNPNSRSTPEVLLNCAFLNPDISMET